MHSESSPTARILTRSRLRSVARRLLKQSMWHQGFNRKFTKLREYFLCVKKTKILTLFNNSSPPCHPIAPSWIVSHTKTTNAILCQQNHTRIRCLCFDLNVNSISAYICCLRMWYSPKWHYRVTWKKQIVESSHYLCFLCAQKVFSYGWTTDVTWIILTISLLHFWALIVLGYLLSIERHEGD